MRHGFIMPFWSPIYVKKRVANSGQTHDPVRTRPRKVTDLQGQYYNATITPTTGL